ncbi:MAG: Crp/Fnr family transcriptional regulator [Desulfobacteraceae bacterium]|nr:Crp/Fnr family transcriptional regulator [Desulfobacteraceae bacterium]
MDIVEHISSIPLFKGLPKAELEDLSMIVEDQQVGRGEIVFSEGDEGTGFYVIISGKVKIFKVSWEGKEQTLHIFGPGEPFGEVPVFGGQQFPANAEALEKGRIFFFPREDFSGLIKKNPDLALNLLAVLSKRLRRFTSLIEGLSLKEVPGRLAAYLLSLSESREGSMELELEFSKGQLASILGTIPETLSRILGRMSSKGLIESHGPRIRLLDLQGLQELSEGETKL